ncbi:uncharacterized protein LOC122386930 [Amphibalanus amphitrite]|uniref:uncharacterized protein LOC122386930 n=1 Tax=Amphibalanus amphitrite TaxID=1232801 RepID=UPI001C90DC9C|nr:uncharacterized protein LOC122386930 [Amphibalanus amphitrite]XP_043232622.1 uncharacterized protein LOC122386930 [Amphibalanus amphitrite]
MAPANHLLFLFTIAGIFRHAMSCNKENKEVAHCLHTYLERDFLSIEAIVYPEREGLSNINRARQRGRSRGRRPGGGANRFGDRPILDGPEMAENCRRIEMMVTCFENVLLTCESLGDFFRYRDLLRAVALVQEWLCEDVIHRFSVLISSVSCYKQALLEAEECADSSLPDNLWPQVLRMEKQREEVCSPLHRQCQCLERSGRLSRCESDAADLYHNVTGMFLNSWCGAAGGVSSSVSLLLAALLVTSSWRLLAG